MFLCSKIGMEDGHLRPQMFTDPENTAAREWGDGLLVDDNQLAH